MRKLILLSILSVSLLVSGCSNSNKEESTGITITKTETQESQVSNNEEPEYDLNKAIEIVQDAGYVVRMPAIDPNIDTTQETEEVSNEPDPEEEFKSAMGTDVLHYRTMVWDESGNVRVSIINTDNDILRFAPEYYYAYFKSDDEVHYIVNNSLWTVTQMTKYGDELILNIKEFDIHDGYNPDDFNKGELLGDFMVNLESGKIHEIENGNIYDYEP